MKMKRLRNMLGRAAYPQVLIGLFAIIFCLYGFTLTHTQARIVPSQNVSTEVVAIATPPGPEMVDCSALPCLALTFDDGPDAALTPRILDALQRHHAKATFFVLGSHVPGNEAVLRRIHAEGHEIGNHSWAHPRFSTLTPEQIEHEITSTQNAIVAAGVPVPHLFRPPYGDVNQAVLSYIPLTVVRWNIDPEDWHPKRQANMLNHMATHAKRGGVVVMHDTEVFTTDALEQLLTQLEPNYKLVTVSELFGLTPGQRGVYFGR